MKKLLLCILALLSAQAFGQAYPGTVLQNSSGNYSRAVPYPQVLVCVANDGNVPCVTRATTYSDSTLGTQCTQTGSSGLLIGNPTSGANCNNPGIGDVNGNFQLYLVNGQYTLCTFSGTWLCQQFTMGGSGSNGIACGSTHSVVYSTALAAFACDPLFTDDGAGNPTARSLGLTDPRFAGFAYLTQGIQPTFLAANSVYQFAPTSVPSTIGFKWPGTLPTNGDCANYIVSGSVWSLGDSGNPCGTGGGGNAASTYRTCTLLYGADNGGGLVNLDLGPQGRQCILPYNATIIQVEVAADAGTPSVLLAINHQGSDTNILSGALSTAASGGVACSTTSGGLGFDGVTTCSSTLQNTSALQGDYIEAVSGTASSAHRMSIFITFTQPNFTSGGTMTSLGLGAPTGFQVSGSPVLTAGTVTFAMPASWTTGDLLLGNGSNSVTRLGIGANTYVLTSNGTTASWQAAGGGGGNNSFNVPVAASSTIPYNGLGLWLSADCITIINGACATPTNGATVAYWTDRSGNYDNPMQEAGTCTFATSQINSEPAVQFDGSACYYRFQGLINTYAPTAWMGEATIFIVARTTSTAGQQVVLGTDGEAMEIRWLQGTSNLIGNVYNGSLVGYTSTTTNLTSWHQANIVCTSLTNPVVRIDRATTTLNSGANCSGFNSGGPESTDELGRSGGGNNYMTGYVAEVLYYHRLLSSTEITQVETYLNGKYGL